MMLPSEHIEAKVMEFLRKGVLTKRQTINGQGQELVMTELNPAHPLVQEALPGFSGHQFDFEVPGADDYDDEYEDEYEPDDEDEDDYEDEEDNRRGNLIRVARRSGREARTLKYSSTGHAQSGRTRHSL